MNDPLAIKVLRGLALDMPARAQSGHSGTALALAPLGWLLYSRALRYSPEHPQWPDRDRFVLSNGHACVLLYGLLHLCGFALSPDDLRDFRKKNSLTPGHPEDWITPGVDTSTGPLGQGLATAVGLALGERYLAAHFGSDVVDHRTYVLCSDGDLMEGITAEASALAGHQRLGKLIVFYDDNQVTIDGPGRLSSSEDVAQRYRAYGWQVLQVSDGEDLAALEAALGQAQTDDRPSLVCVRTIIGFPSPGMQGKAEAHSPHFAPDEIRATKMALGLDPDVSFYLPAEIQEERQRLRVRGQEMVSSWRERLATSPLRDEWQAWHTRPRSLPQGWQAPSFQGPVATRVASGRTLNALARKMPNLLGGSADLAGSTNTLLEGLGDQSPELPQGRNIRYGVREHAMAAVTNGLSQHGGLLAFCSTYFAFSDYMKPALRLAALMKLPAIFVYSHDSLALGEDGPTHQPVEHLAALRALPGFTVVRPADANETAEAWEMAIRGDRGPVALVLSRQSLPCLPRRGLLERGAYILEEAQGDLGVVLLASGSEVHLALEARTELQARSIPTRVVSMPCWELFEEQSPQYQREVLGSGVVRVAIEAGSSLGWHRWVGDGGAVIALDRFGATASGPDLMREAGFTAAHIVNTVLAQAPLR